MTRQNHILHNPASELELPRLGHRLPKHVLSASEVEQVMMQPNLADPFGLRDRAIRHTMATLMHEGGADIRYIQAILGHEDLKTTQIYTQVAIRTLKQIHAATHPAAMLDKTNAPPLPTKAVQNGEAQVLFAALHAEAVYNLAMAKRVIHISEAEAASDFPSLLESVRAGAEIVIEHDARPVAVVRPAEPVRRTISECIALLPEDSTATIDPDFPKDVEAAVASHREPLNPPAWD